MGLKKNIEQKSRYQAKHKGKACMIEAFTKKYKVH